MTILRLEHVAKSFRSRLRRVPVISDVSFDVAPGTLVAIFGPNGSGKTTLANLIVGLDSDFEGTIERTLQRTSIVPMVFQDYRRSLLPWVNVRENILFPMRFAKSGRDDAESRLAELLKIIPVHLDMNARVFQLSGGQAQLVSILRALIVRPELLVCDEPFSALDFQATLTVRKIMDEIMSRLDLSIVFISHDIEEALFLCDKMVFLTPRPSRVFTILDVPFPRPRALDLVGTIEFANLKGRALKIFQDCLATNKSRDT